LPAAIAIAIAAQLLQKLDPGPAPEFAVAAAQSVSPPAQIAGDDQQPCSAACASCGSGRPKEA
jgi:hypothetical protein